MTQRTLAVLIPSFGRPLTLKKCLNALLNQTVKADEIFVIWQKDDFTTRDAALEFADKFDGTLKIVHSEESGVVPAENLGVSLCHSEIVLLIDDDAVASPNWIERHSSFYEDSKIGAVGGPAQNFHSDGRPFEVREKEPIGKLSWYGKLTGNMYDHPKKWSTRTPIQVDHLVGYNMSFRRCAIERFENGLRRYWQLFELDACLAIRDRGYRVMFDFGNIVEHHPTNTAYAGGRDGDLHVKIFNGAYNKAFVLAKHTRGHWKGFVTLSYLLLIGNVGTPGLIAFFPGCSRYGCWKRELRITFKTMRETLAGWKAGRSVRARKIQA